MKKLLSLLLLATITFYTTNANTNVELKLSGDFYYATDNNSGTGLADRPFTSTNLYKDRFSTNNVLFEIDVHSEK